MSRPSFDELAQKASRAVLRFVLKDNLKALILAGSYGRGEGGIATRGLVQHPSGTLDLILLVVGLRSPARQKLASDAGAALETLRRRYLVDIDLSVVDAHAVERDRVSVRWHDARHGHRHLAGDPCFLPGLARFTEGALDRGEAFDLIVHHGGLLVLIKGEGTSTGPAAGSGLGVLRAVLPLVLHGIGDEADARAAREILGVRNPRSVFAKAAWLRMWNLKAASPLGETLRRLGISIDIAA